MFNRYYPFTTDVSSFLGGPFTYGDYEYDCSWNDDYTQRIFHHPVTHVMLFGNLSFGSLASPAHTARRSLLDRFSQRMQGRKGFVPVRPRRVIGPADYAGNEHRVPRPSIYPYLYRERYYMLFHFDDAERFYSHLICFNHHIDVAVLCLDASKGLDDLLWQQLRAIEASNCRKYILFIDHPDHFDVEMREQLSMAFAQCSQIYDALDIVYARDDDIAFPELTKALHAAGQSVMKPLKKQGPLMATVEDWEFTEEGFAVQVKVQSGTLRQGQEVAVINYTSARPVAVVSSVMGHQIEGSNDLVRIHLHMSHENIIRKSNLLIDAESPLTPYRYLAGRFYLCHYHLKESAILEKVSLDLSLRGASSPAVLSLLDTDILKQAESARVMLRLEQPLLVIPRDVAVAQIMDPPYRYRTVYGILKIEEVWDGLHW